MDDKQFDFGHYEVRDGSNGEPGIFLRKYNARMATFSPGTVQLQKALKKLFDNAFDAKDTIKLK